MKIIKRQDGGSLTEFINNYNGDLFNLHSTLMRRGITDIHTIINAVKQSTNEKLKKEVNTRLPNTSTTSETSVNNSNTTNKDVSSMPSTVSTPVSTATNKDVYDDDNSILEDKKLLSQIQSDINAMPPISTSSLQLKKINWPTIYAENSNKIPIENVQPTKKPNQVNDVVNTATDVLGMLGPYGAIASTVLSGATSFLTGTGLASSKYTQNPDSISSGYSANLANDITNFDYIFGKGKSDLEKQKTRDNRIAEILANNRDRKYATAMQQQKNTSILNGGVNTVAVGKTGMKLPITIEVYDEKWFINDISSLKDGGNIIPVGALHARLNNMDSSLDVTKKGIPVVDNNGIQHAEIEKEEWTINKKFTDKLETANKSAKTLKGIELDNLYIEIGKLVVNELLTNTKDTSKLIKNTKV